MESSTAISIAIGVVHIAVAATVLRHARGSTRLFPWLPVLALFFTVRGIDRISEAAGARPPSFSGVADALVAVTLLLLLFGLGRTIADLRAAYEEADVRQREYASALRDYERLVRHRLANPLAAIRGGVAALRDLKTLAPAEREQMLAMVEQETRRLEELSLDPQRLRSEEQRLHPVPGHDLYARENSAPHVYR